MSNTENTARTGKKPKRRNTVTLYVYVPRDVHEQISERATDARRTLADWIMLYAIEPALKKPRPKPLEVNP
jgi:predicted HicB family RNase H-like nuclease